MLQTINDKAKGWLAYLVVGLISVPFALFGINSYIGGGNKLIAATVNGEEISIREVQNELLEQKQRLTSMLGGRLPPNFNDRSLKSQALEALINRALIRQEAKKNGYRASDEEVFSIISNTPSFQKEGVFDKETYERLLASNRRNKVNYENTLRQNISNRQLLNGIMSTSFIPESQVASYQALSKQTRDFEIFTLKLDSYKEQIKPSGADVKAYYDSHSDRYKTKEKVKINYVHLKVDDLAKSVNVGKELLQSYYEENMEQYVTPEERKVAHILVKIVDGKDEEAKKRAEAIYQRILSGKINYEEALSKKAENIIANDLGFLARGDMGPEFEKTAFSLKKDELSPVVRTESGYELIKVSEIKPEVQQTFEQAKVQIEENYRKEKAEKLFQEQVETLNTVAFENDSSLDPAAQAVGLKVETSDWFTREGGKELTANQKVLQEVFSPAVFDEAKNSVLIELSDTEVAVIRIHSKQAPAPIPLADVSEEIKQSIINAETRKLVNKKGEALLAKLKSTGNWASLADIGATVEAVEKFEAVTRQANKPFVEVVRKVFAMNIPKETKSVYSNVIMPSGDYILIALKTVKDGDATVDKTARDLYANAIGLRERSAVIKALREEADVVIFKEKSE